MGGKGITVAGTLICDNYYMVDTYPKQGHLTNIRGVERGVGGIGNLIMDLAKLDENLSLKVSAVVGTGSNGRFVLNTLKTLPNINIDNVTTEGSTSMTIAMEANDNKQRTFFYLPAASDIYDESYIDWDKVEADIFHLEYLLLLKKVDEEDPVYGTHGAKILHDAKKRGMKTSIDIVSEENFERMRKVVRPALKYTDYCIINEVEAEGITEISLTANETLLEQNVPRALEELERLGVSEWAVIHSPPCSFGLDVRTKEIKSVSSLKLPEGYIKSTTGAGDAFCSGVLYSAYKGFGLEHALQLGTGCAACSLSDIGGWAGLRPYKDVMKEYLLYIAP